MRRKILRNRARMNMRATGVTKMNKKYSLKKDKKARSLFARVWRGYIDAPISRTRRRAKAKASM